MTRKVDVPAQCSLVGPSDRANKSRRVELVRIPLRKLGFNPSNRGGTGIVPYHVHEVAHDVHTNSLRMSRYDHVKAVKIPAKDLEHVRKVNAQRCLTAAPSLAPASTDIVYAVLTKTHFVHACKIAARGGVTLFDNGQDQFKFDGKEWDAIQELGVMCAIDNEDLWDDHDAVDPLVPYASPIRLQGS